MSGHFPFVKGHGTENDFVLLPDPDGRVHPDMDAAVAAALCHRRSGIGGDGVIRVVRCEASDDPAAVAARGVAEWFMDYRNADGSLSEMCGNGVRVLGRYLVEHEGADPGRPLPVATRAGIRLLRFEDDGQVTADMGEPAVLPETSVTVDGRSWSATHVSMGNPHAVAFVGSLQDAGSLLRAPSYDPQAFPEGVNVEFVVRRGTRHVAMRVHERGSGETRSCGTGACAAMVATALADGGVETTAPHRPTGSVAYRVDVPGGRLTVTWTGDNRVLLTGPAVLVAEGQVARSALEESNPLAAGT